METGTKVAIAVAAVAAVGITVAVVLEGKASAAPPAPPMLTPGHRYGFQAACPFPFPALPPVGSTAAVAALLGITGVTVDNYSPAADGKSFAVVFDYVGPATALPPIQAGGGTACTSELVDMGPTPIGGVQHSQQLAVFWSKTSSLSKSRPAVVTAPSKIYSVDMGGTGTSTAVSDNQVSLALNGSAGTILVYGGPVNVYSNPIKATVLVS